MHRAAMLNTIKREIAIQKARTVVHPACDVFINHRGVDTKRSIASLLYHQLLLSRIPSFLDNKNMKPGDKLFENIDSAIMGNWADVVTYATELVKESLIEIDNEKNVARPAKVML
ncbi:hypothetical protein E3N88_34732 [Mikania micrantha]|uniref:TIR domain-containing protein n=1 Tax=Mikania micrantha TaxID=192012 RepID=A0A5N6LZB9_9ASTR|nr:hypothetical protein E3N88_34732 [Mikania micrantha]